MADYSNILAKLKKYAFLSGKNILDYYGKDCEIMDKGNDSPLTKADLASNKILMEGLGKFGFPILSEEGKDDKARLNAKYAWIVDPLDGTKDFMQKTNEFTVMAALVKRRENDQYRPVLGLIYQPVAAISYYAISGQGAWMGKNGCTPRGIEVSPETDWEKITMLTSRNHSTELEKKIAEKLKIKNIKACGSSLKACLIAEGRGHVNFNAAPFTWEWDVCAADLIVHEAGGKFSDINGDKIFYNKKNPRNKQGYIASNKAVHKEIVLNIKKFNNNN